MRKSEDVIKRCIALAFIATRKRCEDSRMRKGASVAKGQEEKRRQRTTGHLDTG